MNKILNFIVLSLAVSGIFTNSGKAFAADSTQQAAAPKAQIPKATVPKAEPSKATVPKTEVTKAALAKEKVTVQKLTVQSTMIQEGAKVPKKYSGDGDDFSPPLSWSAGPAGTKGYALSCEDPDAPVGTWWHWILFNISAKTQQLGENLPKEKILANGVYKGVCQGLNDFGNPGYEGPSPPRGKAHRYQFKVVALDTDFLPLLPGCNKEAYQKAIKGHVLAEGQLTGTYQR